MIIGHIKKEMVQQECQICYITVEETEFQSTCQNENHKVCDECYDQLINKRICPFCRQPNPHFLALESEVEERTDQLGFISGSSFASYSDTESDSEYQPWDLFGQQQQIDVIQFTVPVLDRQALLGAITLLQTLMAQSRVQTRAMLKRVEERRNQGDQI